MSSSSSSSSSKGKRLNWLEEVQRKIYEVQKLKEQHGDEADPLQVNMPTVVVKEVAAPKHGVIALSLHTSSPSAIDIISTVQDY